MFVGLMVVKLTSAISESVKTEVVVLSFGQGEAVPSLIYNQHRKSFVVGFPKWYRKHRQNLSQKDRG
jgi:hypothetical protein